MAAIHSVLFCFPTVFNVHDCEKMSVLMVEGGRGVNHSILPVFNVFSGAINRLQAALRASEGRKRRERNKNQRKGSDRHCDNTDAGSINK